MMEEDLTLNIDAQKNEPVVSEQTGEPIDVPTHAAVTEEIVQDTATAVIESSRVSHEGEGDEHVPIARIEVRSLDAVAVAFPFADGETASCKLVDVMFVLRLTMTDRFGVPDCRLWQGFCAAVWSSTRQSMIRHLKEEHEMSSMDCQMWCDRCKGRITDYKVSLHRCLRDQPLVIGLTALVKFACPICPRSFTKKLEDGITRSTCMEFRDVTIL